MHIEYVPLLGIQHDLHRLPRNMTRFQEYLRTVLADDRQSVEYPPLVAMNPMGRDHIPRLLEEYLAFDAEAVAMQTVTELNNLLPTTGGVVKLGLVLVDDWQGGWTNRYAVEYGLRFGQSDLGRPRARWLNDDWLAAVLWSSEAATPLAVRLAIRTTIMRWLYVQEHGPARTLTTMLQQEGIVMSRAGCTTPTLEADDLAYTREVLQPFLMATDMRTCMECLFGDEPCSSLGFTPQGLSPWAGLALALHDARGEMLYQSFTVDDAS